MTPSTRKSLSRSDVTGLSGAYPTDEEVALLTFSNWKAEGCPHLRIEHWLDAERDLLSAYACMDVRATGDPLRLSSREAFRR